MNIVQVGQKPGLSLLARSHSVKQMAGDHLWLVRMGLQTMTDASARERRDEMIAVQKAGSAAAPEEGTGDAHAFSKVAACSR
jgi:hypothetical protein